MFHISSDAKSIRSGLDKLVSRSPREVFYYLRRKVAGREKLHEFSDERVCLFVLSTGRVGTETVAALLGLTRNIIAYHEPRPLLYGLSKLSYEYSDNADVSKVLQEAFFTARQELMKRSLDYGMGYVESSPQVTFLAPFIQEAVPNVRFIHLVRDPRDVIRSGMRRKWYEGHGADKTRITPRPDSSAAREWGSYSAFKKNLWLWNETNSWIMNFTSGVPAERILLLHSEDVFKASPEALEKLFIFAGSSLPSVRRIAHVLGKKLNQQKTGTFPESEVWSDEMLRDLLNIAGRTAQILGYGL
jgi:hypothetical protein